MSERKSSTPTVSRRTLVIAIAVVAALIVGVLGGTEAYARNKISSCISSQFEREMKSSIDVGFGLKPMLVTYFDGKLSEVKVDSQDDKFGPAQGMVVHARFNDIEVTDQGRGGGTINSSSADVTWSNAGIAKTLAGMVSTVTSDPGTGMLTVGVLGGVAKLQLKPYIKDGTVEVETMSANLFGVVGIPTDLVDGIVNLFTTSLQNYPLGLQPTKVSVTDNGVNLDLAGGRTELPAAAGSGSSC